MKAQLIDTVLGPVPDDRLGIVMPHEHFPVYRDWLEQEPPEGYRAKLERWHAGAMRDGAACGVRTMVEVTPQGLSRQTGMHVVPSTGFYVGDHHPEWARKAAEKEITAFE